MPYRFFCVSLLYGAVLTGVHFSTPARASTVLYTLSDQIPATLPAGVTVYTLDGAERLQARIFGDLPADPVEATREARRILSSPDWVAQQQSVVAAWQSVMKAWSLGLEKVPAVVFDDAEVVYGTTDVELARRLRAGGQP